MRWYYDLVLCKTVWPPALKIWDRWMMCTSIILPLQVTFLLALLHVHETMLSYEPTSCYLFVLLNSLLKKTFTRRVRFLEGEEVSAADGFSAARGAERAARTGSENCVGMKRFASQLPMWVSSGFIKPAWYPWQTSFSRMKRCCSLSL